MKEIIKTNIANLNMELSRRDFLKTAGGIAIALVAAKCGVNPNSPVFDPTTSLPIPKSTEVVNSLGDYEFIEQSEIITKLAGPFNAFKDDQRIKDLFEDPSTIEYSASGIKVYDINGQPTAYTFFGATSEVEEKGRTAMVFGGDQGEVIYIVLNRMLSSEGNVGLGITQDPVTGNDLEKSLLIFDTGLSEAEVANMTIEELSSRNINFIPGGILVPTEKLLGTKVNAMLISTESLLPQEVKEKFELAEVDITKMENAKYDKDGLHITLPDGEVIVLTNTDLEKNIYLGQDNVLQYRDESNQNVVYAFDPESKTFLEASKYIQKDKTDPEKYIQVANWDELFALWAKEKMFLIPFDPENTYFPPLDKIYRDYDTPTNRIRREGGDEFNSVVVFGRVPDGMNSPFKFVNFVRMIDDTGNIQGYFVSQQVFNVDDKSFSVMHLYTELLSIPQNYADEQTVFLPQLFINKEALSFPPIEVFIAYYKNRGLVDRNGQTPTIKDLVNKWFDSGHMPEELENIPCAFVRKSIH